MKKTLLGLLAGIALFIGCGSENKLAKINELQAAGNLRDAAKVYKEWVDSSKNPNIERDYIKFLFDNKLFGFQQGSAFLFGAVPPGHGC